MRVCVCVGAESSKKKYENGRRGFGRAEARGDGETHVILK